MMAHVLRVWLIVIFGWFSVALFGCAAVQPHSASPIVPISSFESVAGKWEGMSRRLPDMQDHDWVFLNIGTNGTFTFVSDRETGILLGVGTLTVVKGKLFAHATSGSALLTLHDRAGKPILVVDVSHNDGNHYYLEMTPYPETTPVN